MQLQGLFDLVTGGTTMVPKHAETGMAELLPGTKRVSLFLQTVQMPRGNLGSARENSALTFSFIAFSWASVISL